MRNEESHAARSRMLDPKVRETRQWAMWLHLSLLAGYLIPVAGLVTPIVIWQVKKEELPGLDRHGREAVNWMLSYLIYGAGAAVLSFLLFGIPLLLLLGLLGIVLPVVAAIKASGGECWRYPLAIRFFD